MRRFLTNLYITVKSWLYAMLFGVEGWRYPLVDRVNHGYHFVASGEEMESFGFNLLKHSKLHRYLHTYNQTLVLVAAVEDDVMIINAYCPEVRRPHLEQERITHGQPGTDGCFHYMFHDGILRHALRETAYTREHAFSHAEPVFSLVLPLTESQQRTVAYALYRDPYTTERVSRHVVREDGYTREMLRLNGKLVSDVIDRSPPPFAWYKEYCPTLTQASATKPGNNTASDIMERFLPQLAPAR